MSIGVDELKGAMRKMNRGKATGLDEIPMEFWKRLSGLFNALIGQQRCLKSGGGVQQLRYIRSRVTFKTTTIIGVLRS